MQAAVMNFREEQLYPLKFIISATGESKKDSLFAARDDCKIMEVPVRNSVK